MLSDYGCKYRSFSYIFVPISLWLILLHQYAVFCLPSLNSTSNNFAIKKSRVMSRSTFRVLFYLKRNAPKKNGLVHVMCRITVNGKISQFSCKLDVEEKLWSVSLGSYLIAIFRWTIQYLDVLCNNFCFAAYLSIFFPCAGL